MVDWFAQSPSRYWTLAWSCFSLLTIFSFGPVLVTRLGLTLNASAQRFFPRWVFISLIILTFLAFRWPLFALGEELNPDESQLIAGGITLQSDPIYWRSVDGTTHGPLDAYPLLAAKLVGQPINYGTARLIGAWMLIASILAIYFAVSAYYGDALGRVGCLPAFCFFAFSTFWDFVHYSSEHVPLFLLALGFLFLSREFADSSKREIRSWRWLAGGLLLGAVPLAKLQCAPVALALLLMVSGIEIYLSGIELKKRLLRVGALTVAAACIPVFFILITVIAGEADYAARSYIIQNLHYAGARHYSHADMLRHFWDYAKIGPGFYAFTAGVTAFIIATILRIPRFPSLSLRFFSLTGVFLLTSLIVILAPGRQYTHYLLLLIAPLTLFAGCLFGSCWQVEIMDRAKTTIARGLLLIAFTGLAIWPQIQSRVSQPHPYLSKLTAQSQKPLPPVAQKILEFARPGEPMGHWGWMCRYFVLTGLRQATRIAHTNQQIEYSAQIEYYRASYLADLERSAPPVFIDSVGPGNFVFEHRDQAHECFPALRDYIARHYELVADTEGTRVYVRHDRLANLDATRTRYSP